MAETSTGATRESPKAATAERKTSKTTAAETKARKASRSAAVQPSPEMPPMAALPQLTTATAKATGAIPKRPQATARTSRTAHEPNLTKSRKPLGSAAEQPSPTMPAPSQVRVAVRKARPAAASPQRPVTMAPPRSPTGRTARTRAKPNPNPKTPSKENKTGIRRSESGSNRLIRKTQANN